MGPVRRREMDVIFGENETADGGGWFLADDYYTYQGWIHPHGHFKTWTSDILSDSGALLSFARLSARGAPSEDVILEWIREHGLLQRREPENAFPVLDDGTVNQEPMSVQDFREASAFSYRLLRLFELWRGGDVDALRPRMSLKPLHPPGEPERAKYADVILDDERTPQTARADRPLTDEIILKACIYTVQANVEANLTGVRPVLLFAAGGGIGLRVPDLLTGMFWSFACLVSGKRATAICKGCSSLFEKKRRDQRCCDATCRSRKSRAS